MKKILPAGIVVLALIALSGCASRSGKNGPTIGDLYNQVWVLSSYELGGKTVTLDRAAMAGKDMGEFFTLEIDNKNFSGRAAPNRYFAPYGQIVDRGLSMKPAANTLMASLIQPEGLTEGDYLRYIGEVHHWDLAGNTLILSFSTADGEQGKLIYQRAVDGN